MLRIRLQRFGTKNEPTYRLFAPDRDGPISREEFLDIFFDDLALPHLVKTQLARISEYKRVRAGYSQHAGLLSQGLIKGHTLAGLHRAV